MEDDSYDYKLDDSPIAARRIHLHEPDIALFRTEEIVFSGHGADGKPVALYQSTTYPTATAADGILWITAHLIYVHELDWWTAQITSVGVRSWQQESISFQVVVTIEDGQDKEEIIVEVTHCGSFSIWWWPQR